MGKELISIRLDKDIYKTITESATLKGSSVSKEISLQLQKSYDIDVVCKQDIMPILEDLTVRIDQLELTNERAAKPIRKEVKRLWDLLL